MPFEPPRLFFFFFFFLSFYGSVFVSLVPAASGKLTLRTSCKFSAKLFKTEKKNPELKGESTITVAYR